MNKLAKEARAVATDKEYYICPRARGMLYELADEVERLEEENDGLRMEISGLEDGLGPDQ